MCAAAHAQAHLFWTRFPLLSLEFSCSAAMNFCEIKCLLAAQIQFEIVENYCGMWVAKAINYQATI